jgi:signal transduction histidine kinase
VDPGGLRVIAEATPSRSKYFLSLFGIYVLVAVAFGTLLQYFGGLDRLELQTINRRFETRPWLNWTGTSLSRLDPGKLLDYHEQHEIPKRWDAWDYTLSWLLENNHPPVKNRIVIFNRTPEDEPPDEAIKQMPWMEPLGHYPIPRKTIAEMCDFLATAGAKVIILDSDFPQHADGDKELAAVMHKWTNGYKGHKVPIYMVGTISTGSNSRIVELGVPTKPSSILDELRRLEPGEIDIEKKYLGTTCVAEDTDQVVRSIILRMNVGGNEYESVVVKALRQMGQEIPADLPEMMDIDFACPPKSDLYPIRPWSYLLDPQQKQMLMNNNDESDDVKVKDSVIFIGDGVTDIHSTPFTNVGNNKMSGTEILAHAMDTISRRSWPHRLNSGEAWFYMLISSIFGGAVWLLWKSFQQRTVVTEKSMRSLSMTRLFADIAVFSLILVGSYLGACMFFAYVGWIVPVFVPSLALAFGTLGTILWEREREREDAFNTKLKAAQEKLALTQEKYESELKRREAEATTREILVDKKRRHEFVRRINHDLNAPVSVLNWTVSELQMMEIENTQAKEKVARLVKSSDKLCELIDQLVQSYDYETVPNESVNLPITCDLVSVVHDSVDGQMPLAAMHEDILEWTKPEDEMWVKANPLELTRVVDNIVRNAIKHNPHGTKVNVSIESNGSFHVVSISDNGKGIAPEHINRIFQPGYRVEPTGKDGQGLGLDIAKTLIVGMGGDIDVSSTVMKGTTFKLKLPKSAGPEVQDGSISVEPEQDRQEPDMVADAIKQPEKVLSAD